jgi:pyruvate/2-oxoglutarate dehydrogenase complex dihydrolipoamide dehydrogenase (E3) component
MSAAERVENVILGGGAAGKLLAWELARAGRRTAAIERALIGGSCPNIACMPSKNVIHSARVAQLFRHAAEFGLRAGPATTDMAGPPAQAGNGREHDRDPPDAVRSQWARVHPG